MRVNAVCRFVELADTVLMPGSASTASATAGMLSGSEIRGEIPLMPNEDVAQSFRHTLAPHSRIGGDPT
jgi:hypothetical protein